MDWFEALTGFQETGFEETRSKLVVEGGQLRSLVNGASYGVGNLELPTLQDLRDRATFPSGEKRIKTSIVVGNVRDLHKDLANAGALLQSLCALGEDRCVGPHFRRRFRGLRRQNPDDRLLFDPRASARRQRQTEQKGAAAAGAADARCMGRSRGGLTTKIHALVDRAGLPIALKLSAGQAHDGKSAQDMLSSLKRGQTLLADTAYDSDALREDLAKRGVRGQIKPMPRRVILLSFNKRLYKQRNKVERFFNKLKHYRAVATRYEKHDANYLALVKLAAAQIWMRLMSR